MGAKKQSADRVVAQSFKDLKKIIKRKRASCAAKSDKTGGRRLVSDEDLFHHTMKEVQEIEEFRQIPVYQKNIPLPERARQDDEEALGALENILSGRQALNLPDTQEYVEWVDKDYRTELIHNLHRGKYAVQDCLDLHGMTLEEAGAEVECFIKKSVQQGYRCIKIIHGRGLGSPRGPVVKDSLVTWLSRRYRKYVAAFVTARQCDGGLGALYVLMK